MVVPVADSRDGLVVTRGLEVLMVHWDGEAPGPTDVQVITTVEEDKPGNRFNDGKADASGRLWLGTMGDQPIPGEVVPDQGSLYCLKPDSNRAVKHLSPVDVSNGLIWSLDNKLMYYIDSYTELVEVFDFDIVQGDIYNRRTVFNLTAHSLSGIPDGMTLDADGNLWVAVFYGGKVLNINPKTGELIRTVDFPVTLVSDVVFGGPDFSTLYVTTSKYGLTEEEAKEQPLAGSIFAVTGLGVRGLPGHAAVRKVPPL